MTKEKVINRLAESKYLQHVGKISRDGDGFNTPNGIIIYVTDTTLSVMGKYLPLSTDTPLENIVLIHCGDDHVSLYSNNGGHINVRW